MNAAYRNAIASIESDGSGGYSALGPKVKGGDRAYGRYQVMGANIPQWTKAALGKSMTPQEFLNNPAAQDAVFDHRFGLYVTKYGPEKAARAWFGGEGNVNKPKAKDVLGTDINSYGKKFMASLGAAGAGVPAAATTPMAPPSSAGAALVPLMTKPADVVAAAFDTFPGTGKSMVPSYAAEIAALQNAPVPISAAVEDDSDAWRQIMLRDAADDDANNSRANAVAKFFGEEPVPQIQIPEAIDQSINRYLAQLS